MTALVCRGSSTLLPNGEVVRRQTDFNPRRQPPFRPHQRIVSLLAGTGSV